MHICPRTLIRRARPDRAIAIAESSAAAASPLRRPREARARVGGGLARSRADRGARMPDVMPARAGQARARETCLWPSQMQAVADALLAIRLAGAMARRAGTAPRRPSRPAPHVCGAAPFWRRACVRGGGAGRTYATGLRARPSLSSECVRCMPQAFGRGIDAPHGRMSHWAARGGRVRARVGGTRR